VKDAPPTSAEAAISSSLPNIVTAGAAAEWQLPDGLFDGVQVLGIEAGYLDKRTGALSALQVSVGCCLRSC
jgi:hypothetical protein